MSDFKRIPIKIDAATCNQINDYGSVVREEEYIRLLFDETVILCCEFYDVDWSSGAAVLTQHPINPTLSLAAFGDNDFDAATAFMFLTEQSAITPDTDGVNDIGDWHGDTTADPAQGQLSFKVNTNTDRFTEAVGSGGSYKKYYFVITGVPEGETAKTVLAYFRFKAENRPSSSSGIPATADPEYYDAQQIDALLKAGYELQFSIDGSTLWHDTQVTEDRYWRYRYPGGIWSDGIKMIDSSDFSGYSTKEAFVDADTLLSNDSANSGNPIAMTILKVWNYIKGKADTIYAAITHSHAISEVTDLQTSLDGKSDTTHNHDGAYSAFGHGHAIADVTDLQSSLDGKQNSLGFTPEDSANKGAANGYAGLDANGLVPEAQLPSDKINSTASVNVGISGKHGAYLVGGSAVVDNGNGTVTFEVYHCFLDDGDSIRIAHTTNYDGTYSIVSHTDGDYHPDTNPTGNKGTVTITATYVAETLPSGDAEAVMQYVQPQSEIDKIISFLANHRNLDLNWYALQITFDTGGYYDFGSEMVEITKVRNGVVKLDFAYEPPENDYAGATTYARNNKVLTINSTNGLGALYLHEIQIYELRMYYGIEFKNSNVQAVLITKCDIDGSYIDGCKFSATVPGSASENACFYEAESVASLTLSACVFSGGSAWVRGNFLKLAGPRFVSPYPFYGIVSTFRCQTSVAPTGAQTAAYRSTNGGSVYLNGVNQI